MILFTGRTTIKGMKLLVLIKWLSFMKDSVSLFSRARDVTVTGGEIYAAGGNLTVQRIELSCIIKNMTDRRRPPWNCGYVGMFFGPQTFHEGLNHCQRESLSLTIDKRVKEMISRLHLPPVISTGFLYVMDATGRRHTLTMDMTHSFEVCPCVRYCIICILYLFKFPAI